MDFDDEIVIEDVINDINIDDINTININNELMHNIENENRNSLNNNNINIEFPMENNSNNREQNNNSENPSNREEIMNNLLFNTRVDMMNILRDVLDDDGQETSENNLNSFSHLLNNIQSTLINASDRLPSLISELNENISSAEDSIMNEDEDENNNDNNNENIESPMENNSNNQSDNTESNLENDYMNLIQTGNLRSQIRNQNISTNIQNIDEDNSQIDADHLYALQLQQQEYRMAVPNVNSILRERTTTHISRPPIVPRSSETEEQSSSVIRERTGVNLEHRDGMLRIRRRPLSSRESQTSNDIFNIIGQSLFSSLPSNSNPVGRGHSSHIRNFRDIISSIANDSINERTYENIPVVLEEEELNNLKQIVFDDNCIIEGKHQKCTICLGPYEKGENLTILPCGHGFHKDCINNWLKDYSYKCPICRSETGSGRPVFNHSTRTNRPRPRPRRNRIYSTTLSSNLRRPNSSISDIGNILERLENRHRTSSVSSLPTPPINADDYNIGSPLSENNQQQEPPAPQQNLNAYSPIPLASQPQPLTQQPPVPQSASGSYASVRISPQVITLNENSNEPVPSNEIIDLTENNETSMEEVD
jgi:hypothetical protein